MGALKGALKKDSKKILLKLVNKSEFELWCNKSIKYVLIGFTLIGIFKSAFVNVVYIRVESGADERVSHLLFPLFRLLLIFTLFFFLFVFGVTYIRVGRGTNK